MWSLGLTLAMTLTYIFQGKIWNLLYLSQKWSDFHETKRKPIDWTLGLKCDHWVWPWPWPWPWIFKVKYGICYISAKNGPTATKRKANISIELQGLKYGLQFWPWPWPWPDHDHDHLVIKVRCVDLPDSDRGDFSCRRAVNSSSFMVGLHFGTYARGHSLMVSA